MNSIGSCGKRRAKALPLSTTGTRFESARRAHLIASIIGKIVGLTNEELETINIKLERKHERYK